jgi:hypothetical protein
MAIQAGAVVLRKKVVGREGIGLVWLRNVSLFASSVSGCAECHQRIPVRLIHRGSAANGYAGGKHAHAS